MARETSSRTDFYDGVWRAWGHLDRASPAAFHRRRLVLELATRCPIRPERILDAGCGRGELLREFARHFPAAELWGADVSAESLAATTEAVERAELFQLDLGDPDALAAHPDKLGRHGLVVCSEVLEHLADDTLGVRLLGRLLAPGGRLLVTVPSGKMSRFDELIGHQRHYRPRELVSLFERAGLEAKELVAWGFPFHTLYRSLVRIASRWSLSGGTAEPGRAGHALGSLYGWSGALLRPLFYANLSRWGEQLVAVASTRG
jgi:SAM-dependent methyltransferase